MSYDEELAKAYTRIKELEKYGKDYTLGLIDAVARIKVLEDALREICDQSDNYRDRTGSMRARDAEEVYQKARAALADKEAK